MHSKKRKEQPSISDLPNEMLEEIFSYLEFTERLSASLVCRRWSKIALNLDEIRLNLYSLDEDVRKILLNSDRPYRYLEVNGTSRLDELISKFGNNLKTLQVSEVQEWNWLSSLCGLPELEDLHIACSYRYDNLEVPSSRPCLSMRWLTVEKIGCDVFSSFNSFISDTFPELTYLKVEYFSGTFRLSYLPKLEYLYMIGYNPIFDDLLKDFHSLPNLSSINLTARRLECDYASETLNIGHIRTVKINTDDPLDNIELLKLTEVFPAMTSFAFNRWNLCSQSGIDDARRRLPNCSFNVLPCSDAEEEEVNTEPDASSSSSDSESNTS